MNFPWLAHLLLHSVGIAAACGLALIIRAVWRRDPVASYHLLVLLLIATLSLPAVQLMVQGRGVALGSPMITWLDEVWPQSSDSTAPESPASKIEEERDPATVGLKGGISTAPAYETPTPTAEQGNPVGKEASQQGIPAGASRSTDASALLARPLASNSGAAADNDAENGALALPHAGQTGFKPSAGALFKPSAGARDGILAGIYFLGVAAFGLRQLLRIRRTSRLVKASTPLRTGETRRLWNRIAAKSRLRSSVQLRVSDTLPSPACWGLWRAHLLIPRHALQANRHRALEWALRHELVHLERGDPKVAALQTLMTTVFWFHPAAWWMSRQLSRLREQSCDLLVVRKKGARKSYALALLDFCHGGVPSERWRGSDPACPTLLHWSHSRSELRRRIEMLALKEDSCSTPRKALRWLAVGGMLAALWCGQITLAAAFPGSQDAKPDESKAKQAKASLIDSLRELQEPAQKVNVNTAEREALRALGYIATEAQEAEGDESAVRNSAIAALLDAVDAEEQSVRSAALAALGYVDAGEDDTKDQLRKKLAETMAQLDALRAELQAVKLDADRLAEYADKKQAYADRVDETAKARIHYARAVEAVGTQRADDELALADALLAQGKNQAALEAYRKQSALAQARLADDQRGLAERMMRMGDLKAARLAELAAVTQAQEEAQAHERQLLDVQMENLHRTYETRRKALEQEMELQERALMMEMENLHHSRDAAMKDAEMQLETTRQKAERDIELLHSQLQRAHHEVDRSRDELDARIKLLKEEERDAARKAFDRELDSRMQDLHDLEMAIEHNKMDAERAQEILDREQSRLDQDSHMGLRELEMRREALEVEHDTRRADLETTFHAEMTEMQAQRDRLEAMAKLHKAEERALAEGDFKAALSDQEAAHADRRNARSEEHDRLRAMTAQIDELRSLLAEKESALHQSRQREEALMRRMQQTSDEVELDRRGMEDRVRDFVRRREGERSTTLPRENVPPRRDSRNIEETLQRMLDALERNNQRIRDLEQRLERQRRGGRDRSAEANPPEERAEPREPQEPREATPAAVVETKPTNKSRGVDLEN